MLFLVAEKALHGLYLKELKYTFSTIKNFIFMGLCLISYSTFKRNTVKYKLLLLNSIILLML